MGLLDIFRRKTKLPVNNSPSQINILDSISDGPTFLEGYTIATNSTEKPEQFEWKRKLQSPSGGYKFRIKYYGDVYKDASGLLIGTDVAQLLVIAEDVETHSEILLFDGCRHGYNAMFCDTYTEQQRNGRIANKYYIDNHNNEVFEIILSANYQMSVDEFWDMVDKNGNVELVDGTVLKYDVAWRNCYDIFRIYVIDERGIQIEIVSEELA